MNLPPKSPRFALPVSGAKVGSVVRPVADGATTPIAKPRFGLRSNARTLASIAPTERPSGPIIAGDEVA